MRDLNQLPNVTKNKIDLCFQHVETYEKKVEIHNIKYTKKI